MMFLSSNKLESEFCVGHRRRQIFEADKAGEQESVWPDSFEKFSPEILQNYQ
jgi:hypothetical protein